MNSYFMLTTSNGSLSKKFKATAINPMTMKRQSLTETLGGLSIVSGTPIKQQVMVVKVQQAVSDSSYGTLAELETFFNLNNPSSTPSNTVTYQAHDGTQYYAKIIGDFKPQPLSTILEGVNSYWVVQLTLLITGEV